MEKKLELRLILNAVDKLTRPLRAANREAVAANQVLQQTKAKVKELEAAQRDIASYRGMTNQLNNTTGALLAAKIKADELARAHAAADNPTKKMTASLARAGKEVERLTAQEASQTGQLAQLKSKLDAAGLSTNNLARHESRLKAEIADGNFQIALQTDRLNKAAQAQARLKAARSQYDKTQAFAGSMQGAGMSSMGAGMVAAAPLIASGGMAINFEDAMLDVKKVVDFDTPEQFQQMNRDVINLSRDLGLPAEGIAQIIAAAGQAKIPRAELQGFALDAGQMGVAFGTTAEDAGQKMATWRVAFGMTQNEVRGLADQINYLGDNGRATALEISDVVTRVGPLAGVAGLASAEVAAMGATLVAMGAPSEVAATAVKNVITTMTAGSAATKTQQAAYKALGLEAGAVAKSMQVDADGTIIDLMERVNQLSPDKQASMLAQLFGRENVGTIAPMLAQLDVLKTNLNGVADSSNTSGSMATEFANRMSGAKGAMDQAKEGLKGVATTAGMEFLPLIRDIALRVSEATKGMTEFAQKHPNVVKAVATLVGIIAAALIVFGALAMVIAAILGPFALMRLALALTAPMFTPVIAGVVGATKAFAAWGLAMLANPITWIVLGIVAAIAAVAAVVYLVHKNWGTISEWFSGIWAKVKTGFSDFISFAINAFLKFSPAGLIVSAFMAVWPLLTGIGEKFKTFGSQLLQGLVNGIKGGVPGILRAIAGVGSSMIKGFKERLGIRSPSRVFAGFGDDTMSGLTRGLDRSSASPVASISRTATAMAAAGAVSIGASAAFADAPDFETAPRFEPSAAATAATGQRGGQPVTNNYEINIHAAPGMDIEALARLVIEKTAQLQGQSSLAALDDSNETWS